MSISNVYRMHSIDLGSGSITQLTDLNLNTGIAELVVAPSGDVAPGFTGINEGRPEMSFSTQQLKTILDECTQDGISADLSGGNVDAFYRIADPFGQLTAEASSAHMRARCASNSMLCWSTIRANQGGLADVSCRLVPIMIDSNAPMQVAASQAIATAASVQELFTLGPVKLNGSFVSGVQDLTIDSGISVRVLADSGSPWPTFVHVDAVAPRIRFTTAEAGILATLGVTGTPLTALIVYLRKKAAGGAVANVADATAEHIGFTVASGGGMAVVRAVQGMDGMAEVEIFLKRPSANAAWWTIDTTSAIA